MTGVQPITEVETRVVRATIMRLLSQAREASGGHREHEREPFCGPVTVVMGEGIAERRFSCLSRDISPAGIGLLHSMPLPLGDVKLTIRREFGEEISLRGEVIWCQPGEEGWYMSGVRFAAVCPS